MQLIKQEIIDVAKQVTVHASAAVSVREELVRTRHTHSEDMMEMKTQVYAINTKSQDIEATLQQMRDRTREQQEITERRIKTDDKALRKVQSDVLMRNKKIAEKLAAVERRSMSVEEEVKLDRERAEHRLKQDDTNFRQWKGACREEIKTCHGQLAAIREQVQMHDQKLEELTNNSAKRELIARQGANRGKSEGQGVAAAAAERAKRYAVQAGQAVEQARKWAEQSHVAREEAQAKEPQSQHTAAHVKSDMEPTKTAVQVMKERLQLAQELKQACEEAQTKAHESLSQTQPISLLSFEGESVCKTQYDHNAGLLQEIDQETKKAFEVAAREREQAIGKLKEWFRSEMRQTSTICKERSNTNAQSIRETERITEERCSYRCEAQAEEMTEAAATVNTIKRELQDKIRMNSEQIHKEITAKISKAQEEIIASARKDIMDTSEDIKRAHGSRKEIANEVYPQVWTEVSKSLPKPPSQSPSLGTDTRGNEQEITEIKKCVKGQDEKFKEFARLMHDQHSQSGKLEAELNAEVQTLQGERHEHDDTLR